MIGNDQYYLNQVGDWIDRLKKEVKNLEYDIDFLNKIKIIHEKHKEKLVGLINEGTKNYNKLSQEMGDKA